jgi:hypothetical protein
MPSLTVMSSIFDGREKPVFKFLFSFKMKGIQWNTYYLSIKDDIAPSDIILMRCHFFLKKLKNNLRFFLKLNSYEKQFK